MSAATVLFPFGVRLSTWLAGAAFVGVAVWRRDWRPLAAGFAWIWGFEVAFQVACIAAGYNFTPVVTRLGWVLVGIPIVVGLSSWVRPDWRIFLAAAAMFGVWGLAGFGVNTHETVYSVGDEILNEATKTLWALAYLVPLLSPFSFRLPVVGWEVST